MTERAVVDANEHDFEVVEVAPGTDLEQEVLACIGFQTMVSVHLKLRDLKSGITKGTKQARVPRRTA